MSNAVEMKLKLTKTLYDSVKNVEIGKERKYVRLMDERSKGV